jgi:hypothetical protein
MEEVVLVQVDSIVRDVNGGFSLAIAVVKPRDPN